MLIKVKVGTAILQAVAIINLTKAVVTVAGIVKETATVGTMFRNGVV